MSAASFNGVTDACVQADATLRKIWERSGEDKFHCQAVTASMMGAINALFRATIATEQERLDAQLSALAAVEDESKTICLAIGQSFQSVDNGISSVSSLIVQAKEKNEALKLIRTKRAKDIDAALSSLTSILSEMGELDILPPNTPEAGLTEERLAELQFILQAAQQAKEQRVEEVAALMDEMESLWDVLGEGAELPLEKRLQKTRRQCIATTDLTLLTERKERLANLQTSRRREIEHIRDEVTRLWEGLAVSFDERNQFIAAVPTNLSLGSVQTWSAELQRVRVKRNGMLGALVAAARDRLADLWEQLHFGPEDRSAFAQASEATLTEDLLHQHEAEIARLEQLFDKMQPLLKLINRRISLLKAAAEMEAAADATRLTSKGKERGDPGRLLREERLRVSLKKELPRIHTDLEAQVPEWEAQHGHAIRVDDRPVLEWISEGAEADEERRATVARERAAEKAKQMEREAKFGTIAASRAGLKTPGPKTPSASVRGKPTGMGGVTMSTGKKSSRTPLSAVQFNTPSRIPSSSQLKATINNATAADGETEL